MSAKDWIGGLTGVVALAVSLATTYFNVVRQTDDVRVIFSEEFPNVGLAYSNPPHITVKADHNITFINSGNRSAAVMRIRLLVQQPRTGVGKPATCDFFYSDHFSYRFDPIVLKPGEIVAKKIALNPATAQEVKDGGQSSALSDANRRRDSYYAVVCLMFNVVVPNEFAEEVIKPVYWSEFPVKEDFGAPIAANFLTPRNQPVILWQRSGPFWRM